MSYSPSNFSLFMLLVISLPCFAGNRAHCKKQTKQLEIFQAVNDGDNEALVRILRTAEEHTLNAHGPEGETPLHVATSVGNTLFVEFLVNAGADVTAMDDDLYPPLTIAARTGHYGITAILLREPSPLNPKDKFQATPLHYASEAGYHEIVRLLVKRYVSLRMSLDERDLHNKTPLHWAAEKDKYRTAQILLRAGSNGLAVDWQMRTPLHLAALAGFDATVKTVLKYGAYNDQEDKDHKTPLDLAIEKGHRKCALYLLKYGAYVSDSAAGQMDTWENCDWRNVQLTAAKRLMSALESEGVRATTALAKELNILIVFFVYDTSMQNVR